MNVYVENILARAKPLNVSNIKGSYAKEMLFNEVLSNDVVFDETTTVISAKWPGVNNFADTVAILDSNWSTGTLEVKSQSAVVINRTITSQGKHTIIKLPHLPTGLPMISEITLNLNTHNNNEKLRIGILFVGIKTELPLFNIGFKQKLNVNSNAERTRYGIVYGSKKKSLRSFDVTFSDIDNSRRLVMEDYIDEVQFVRPHLVEPYESPEYQPVYAALTSAGGFDKEKGDEFRWNSALSYMEAG